MFPLLLISSCPLSLPSPPLSFLLPQQSCAQSFVQQAFAEPQWRVHPSQGQGDKNELRGFASEELIEEFAPLPSLFSHYKAQLPPSTYSPTATVTTKLLLKHIFFPPFFPRMLHNSPIPQDVFLSPLKEPHLGWWKLETVASLGGGRGTLGWGEKGELPLPFPPTQLKNKQTNWGTRKKHSTQKVALILKASSTFFPHHPCSLHRDWNQMLFSSFASS